MRVIVTGSRTWRDAQAIHERLVRLGPSPDTVIIHGYAKGADSIADTFALVLGFSVQRYPADWKRYGKKAGLYRNIEMVKSGPDLVLAFWDGKSRGTAHCISVARARGIPVEVISPSQVGTSPRR